MNRPLEDRLEGADIGVKEWDKTGTFRLDNLQQEPKGAQASIACFSAHFKKFAQLVTMVTGLDTFTGIN